MARPAKPEDEAMVENNGFFDGLDVHVNQAGKRGRVTNFWREDVDPRQAKIDRMKKKADKWNERLLKARAAAEEYKLEHPSSSDSE